MQKNTQGKKNMPQRKKASPMTHKKVDKVQKSASTQGAENSKTAVIAIAVTLGVVMLLGIVLGIVALVRRPYHFARANIARYMSIDPESYRGLTLKLQLDEVDDAALERAIRQTLVKNKDKDPHNNGAGDRTGEITLGDEVYIWYRGYYLEDGKRVEFDSGCNITSTSITDDQRLLEIGSGSFIAGFEEGLLGHKGEDTSNLRRYTSGTVEAGDIVYLRMSAIFPDGTAYENKTVRIDLSDPALASQYGTDFAQKVIGAQVGSALGTFQTELEGAVAGLSTATFMNVHVTMRTTGEERPLTVETRFPAVYEKAPELAGKTAYFEVYISQVVHYETPDLTDSFITNTLGMKADALVSYEGKNLTEKYRLYVRAQLLAEYEKDKQTAAETAMWNKLVELVEVRSVPKRATRTIYRDYLDDFKADYEYYKDYYGYNSIEKYAADALPLQTGQSYEDYLWQMAESAAREKMMFYLVMQTEGITLTDEENEACIEAAVDEMVAYYRDEVYADEYRRDKYKTEAEYQTAIESLRRQIVDYYGEGYFEESAHYDLVMERLLSYATVVVE